MAYFSALSVATFILGWAVQNCLRAIAIRSKDGQSRPKPEFIDIDHHLLKIRIWILVNNTILAYTEQAINSFSSTKLSSFGNTSGENTPRWWHAFPEQALHQASCLRIAGLNWDRNDIPYSNTRHNEAIYWMAFISLVRNSARPDNAIYRGKMVGYYWSFSWPRIGVDTSCSQIKSFLGQELCGQVSGSGE